MKKKIITILLIILFIFVVIIGVMAIQETQQEDKLKKEADELNLLMNSETLDMDKINEMLDRTVTTGDYAEVEKSFKEYCRAGVTSLNNMIVAMEDERMYTMLTPENYEEDGPEFKETRTYINETKEVLETERENFLLLLEKEEILKYIENKNLSKEYVDLYEEIIQIDADIESEKQTIDESITMMIQLLDSAEEILDFLEENKNDWEVSNGQLTFSTEELSEEYNEMIENL